MLKKSEDAHTEIIAYLPIDPSVLSGSQSPLIADFIATTKKESEH
jgi:hypothetical protein